jgi:hypothetical protein
MRPYKPDVSNLKFVPHGNHKTIGIPFDIEYNPVITENTGCPVFCFNVPRTLPLCLLGFSIPRSQGLFRISMNKGEVLVIAGKPDREESYYRSTQGRLVRISDWYYVRVGENAESTLLKFQEDTLLTTTPTPTR